MCECEVCDSGCVTVHNVGGVEWFAVLQMGRYLGMQATSILDESIAVAERTVAERTVAEGRHRGEYVDKSGGDMQEI